MSLFRRDDDDGPPDLVPLAAFAEAYSIASSTALPGTSATERGADLAREHGLQVRIGWRGLPSIAVPDADLVLDELYRERAESLAAEEHARAAAATRARFADPHVGGVVKAVIVPGPTSRGPNVTGHPSDVMERL